MYTNATIVGINYRNNLLCIVPLVITIFANNAIQERVRMRRFIQIIAHKISRNVLKGIKLYSYPMEVHILVEVFDAINVKKVKEESNHIIALCVNGTFVTNASFASIMID